MTLIVQARENRVRALTAIASRQEQFSETNARRPEGRAFFRTQRVI